MVDTFVCWLGSPQVTAAILTVQTVLIWLYLRATRAIQRSATEQAEGISRPAIFIWDDGRGLAIKNIGNGPAIEISWSMPFLELLSDLPELRTHHSGTYSVLRPGEEHLLLISSHQVETALLIHLGLCCFDCSYKSLGNAACVTTHVFGPEGISKTYFERKTEPNNFFPWSRPTGAAASLVQLIRSKLREMDSDDKDSR